MPARARRTSPIARITQLGALCIAATLALTACAGTSSEQADGEGSPDAIVAVEIPDTKAGQAAQFLLDAINAEADITVRELEGKFHSSFTDAVSLDELTEILNTQFRPARPFTATAHSGGELESSTRLESELSDPLDMQLVLESTDLITGLRFTPAEKDDWVAPTSIAEVSERIEEFPATVHALIISEEALLNSGDALLDRSSEESAPLGSAFKLYVLLAVAEAITAGDLQWDEELEINDSVRSLPSGELQDAATGTRVSVREAAGKMIAISDNTATDMLIHRLGRERIEAAVVASGHHDPAQMRPFMSTRELFQIGWGDPELLQAWKNGDEAQRRALLDSLGTTTLDTQLITQVGALVWTDDVEWFASPRDIARVHVALNQQTDPEIRAILSANSGIPAPGWSYVAFKGGSSPGVLTGSWLVTDAEGNSSVIVMQASSDSALGLSARQNDFFRLAQSALALTLEAQ